MMQVNNIVAMLLVVLLVAMSAPVIGLEDGPEIQITRGTLDAHVAGTVLNASAGFPVSVSAMDTGTNTLRYFNGTTDPLGRFNITVDSDPANLLPFSVEIKETYYLIPTRAIYFFEAPVQSGQTQHVPHGDLELADAPLGDLRITILNGSSLQPLPHPTLNIMGELVPDPPFPTAKVGDSQGSALYLGIRAVTTKVTAGKSNFLTLEDSASGDTVVVLPGVQTNVTFVLDEKPWPFTTDPAVGSSDVNHTRPITIDYDQEMDPISITDVSAFKLSPEAGGDPLELTAESLEGNTRTRLTPMEAMEYNKTYVLRIDNTVKTKLGAKPLWRAMEVTFRTELPPAVVNGRVVDSVTGSPVSGVRLKLKALSATSDASGDFMFPLVVPDVYTLEIQSSYLYLGASLSSLAIEKGEVRDLGDIPVDPRPNGSLEVIVYSGPLTLAGAWVHIDGSDLNMTTLEDGIAHFERTRTGLVTIKVGAPHHTGLLEQTSVSEGQLSLLSVVLIEDPMLVSVVPTISPGQGLVDPVTRFILIMPEEIDFSTLSVSIWSIDDQLNRIDRVPILPVSTGEAPNTYSVSPTSSLIMEKGYVLTIDMGLLASASGQPLLWRDLTYYFRTPDHPLSYLTGVILLDGMPLGGLEVEFGLFSDVTDDEGFFNITVDLSTSSLEGVLGFNGSPWGYESFSQSIIVTPGMILDVGTKGLMMLPGRCDIDPADGSTGIEPGTSVTFSFSDPVKIPENNLGMRLFVAKKGSTTPVPGDYEVAEGNASIAFTPAYPLEEGAEYYARVTPSLILETEYPACPVGWESHFTVRMPMVQISLLSPEASVLDALPLDEPIVISFSLPANRSMVESSIDIEPDPLLVRYIWRTSTELELILFLSPLSEYSLTIPRLSIGLAGQMGQDDFVIEFVAGSIYGRAHEERSFSLLPDPSNVIRPGQEIRLNGLIDGSAGYAVIVVLSGAGIDEEYDTIVDEEGLWDIAFKVPNTTGTFTLTLSIGIPGASSCIQPRTYTLDVTSDTEVDEPFDIADMIVPALIGLFIVILVIVALAVFLLQRKRAKESLENIQYDSVDIDMEE